MTKIEFAAEFGGKDARSEVYPFFRSLKKTEGSFHFDSFSSLDKVTFILRVDGSVKSYTPSTVDHIIYYMKENEISIDLHIGDSQKKNIHDKEWNKLVEMLMLESDAIFNTKENLKGIYFSDLFKLDVRKFIDVYSSMI